MRILIFGQTIGSGDHFLICSRYTLFTILAFRELLLPHVTPHLDIVVLPSSPLTDSLAWQHSSDGKLFAKQAKLFLTPAAPALHWPNLIWRSCIPPSHAFIFWRLFHGKMPTDKNLRDRGCITISVCNFCMKTDESSVHLFLCCPFVMELWSWIGGKLNYVLNLISVISLIASVPTHCSSQAADIYVSVVVHTLHIIWLSRNSMRFSPNVVSLHAAKVPLQAVVSLSGNMYVGHCLLSNIPLLDAFFVAPHHRRFKDIITVHWKAPTPPWMKVNTDGLVVGNHVACGGLFRDHLGTFLGAFTCNLGIASVFSSEIQGFIFTLEFAAQNGWSNL